MTQLYFRAAPEAAPAPPAPDGRAHPSPAAPVQALIDAAVGEAVCKLRRENQELSIAALAGELMRTAMRGDGMRSDIAYQAWLLIADR